MVLNSTVTVAGSGTAPFKSAEKEIVSKYNKRIGLAFPMGLYPRGGYLTKEAGKALLRSNIWQMILTSRGERVMLPDFGCDVKRYVFEPLDEITVNLIKNELLGSISKYEPRVRIEKLRVDTSDQWGVEGLQTLFITLTLKVKESEEPAFDVTVEIK